MTSETAPAQASGRRARAAPPRWRRPPARHAQRGESGGKRRSRSGGVPFHFKRVSALDWQPTQRKAWGWACSRARPTPWPQSRHSP